VGLRQGEGEQIEELREARTVERDRCVDRGFIGQMGDGAVHPDRCRTGGGNERHRVGRRFIPQGEHRRPGTARGERKSQILSAASEGDAGRGSASLRAGGRIVPRYFNKDRRILDRIVIAYPAVNQREAPDPCARVVVSLVAIEQPVATTIGPALERDDRTIESDVGQEKGSTEKSRQVDRQIDRGRGNHLLLARPRRIRERHVGRVQPDPRPIEFPLQVAVDCKLAPGSPGDQMLDRAAQMTLVQQHDDRANKHGQDSEAQADPFHLTGHGYPSSLPAMTIDNRLTRSASVRCRTFPV